MTYRDEEPRGGLQRYGNPLLHKMKQHAIFISIKMVQFWDEREICNLDLISYYDLVSGVIDMRVFTH